MPVAENTGTHRTMTVVTANVCETCPSLPGDLPASPSDVSQEDSMSAPPPLVPRRPARRLATIGPMPRRRVPAIPPPVESTAELQDPIEQNRINEAVWIRRTDIRPAAESDDEDGRPPLPARTRRCVADAADRIKSAPVTRPTASFCCLRHHLEAVVPSPPRDNIDFRDTHFMISLEAAADQLQQSVGNNTQPATSGRQQPAAAADIVALPRWPMSSSPERNRARTASGVAGLRLKKMDNEYVPSPTRGETHFRLSDCNENHTTNESRPPVCPPDAGEKKRTSAEEDNRTGDCTSSGPMVCPRCGGCRCKSCSDADRRVRSAVELCSCAGPVRYLCRTGADQGDAEYFEDRAAGRGRRSRRCRHVALGVLVAALCLPCLCCYWPMRAGHEVVSTCKRKFAGQLGVCRCKVTDTGDPV